jgi:hypothetical protein
MGKAILVTNETPNDQGSIIRTKTIDFSRFDSNPVMLYHHGEDPELKDTPIGHWENRQVIGTQVFMTPVFTNSDNPKIKLIKDLYDEGNLKAASIGGAITYISDFSGNPKVNKEGLKESDYFLMYECSLVPMGSNPDALTKASLSAKIYDLNQIKINQEEVLQLKSKFTMAQETEKVGLQEDDYKKIGEFAAGLKEPSLIGKFFASVLGLNATVGDSTK